VPNLSVLDGWWPEAYNGTNGWAVGQERDYSTPDEQDWLDAQALYEVLEREIVPTFYDQRDTADVPSAWVQICKEAMISVAPYFCTRRMLTDYMQQLYLPPAREHAT
jgi:starch phosphorylase